MKTSHIYIKFQKEGIHRYPEAGTNPALADVNFLAFPHRHMFHFKVIIKVFHNDRDIEYIQFKRELENLYSEKTLDLDFKSCEMIADDLLNYIKNEYPNRSILIDVSEDHENGSVIVYDPDEAQDSE